MALKKAYKQIWKEAQEQLLEELLKEREFINQIEVVRALKLRNKKNFQTIK